MRGSIKGQTLHLLNTSGIKCIGESKYQAKDGARAALAAEGRSGISRNIATKTGIHSDGSKNNYLGKWAELGRFAKEEYGVRDLEKLTGDHVREFMAFKCEMGVSYAHWSGYASAFGKLENALNLYSQRFDRGNLYDLRSAIESLRPDARAELPRFDGTRNYDNPGSLVAAIGNQSHQLVAKIQLESGLRVAGASQIAANQLRGLTRDTLTGKEVGQIYYKGKGGKPGIAQVLPQTYNTLTKCIREHGALKASADGYRQSLMNAAKDTGQAYNGSHGLRWNFAQERFSELQRSGASYEKCLGAVSNELGHNRIEITQHYLGIQ